MRKITITIEDEETGVKSLGTINMEHVNDLYAKTGINGITQIAILVNDQLNKTTNKSVELAIPNELTTLPEGGAWQKTRK